MDDERLNARELLGLDFSPAPARLSAFEHLYPSAAVKDDPLPALSEVFGAEDVLASLERAERERAYPDRAIAALRAAGLARLFAGDRATVPHGCALSALLARHSGSLAVAVGVNYLGLLPIHLTATDTFRERVDRRVADGAFAALLLTELASGSSLADIETTAHHDTATGEYVLHGTKDLINGANRHELLVVLARIQGQGASLFVVPRDTAGVEALGRWTTLPVRGADIGGVRLSGVRVPADHRLGRDGDGFAIVARTLTLTRGGIGSFAAGTAAGAVDIAHAYCAGRRIAGTPIATLGAIAWHLRRMRAFELLAAAAAIKACTSINADGDRAVVDASVAKLCACDAAERAVTEGRLALGARALLEHAPYERFVRDVLVYGTFDGTRHVVLELVAWRLAQLVASPEQAYDVASVTARFTASPRHLAELRSRGRPVLPDPRSALAALAPATILPLAELGEITRALAAAVTTARSSGMWDREQAVRLALAEVYARSCALVALIELAEPGCRALLGLAPASIDGADVALAFSLGATECARGLRDTLAMAGLPADAVEDAERAIMAAYPRAAR